MDHVGGLDYVRIGIGDADLVCKVAVSQSGWLYTLRNTWPESNRLTGTVALYLCETIA
jgi:hypothetical protein